MSSHNLAQIRHIIAIVAGKGGVGKSTLAVQLARYFAKKGQRVGLMDADLYGPSLQKMIPEEIPAFLHPENLKRICPAEAEEMKLISMAYFLEGGDPASIRAPIANGIVKQFIHLVEWGELDYLFIDFPPGTGDIQLTLIQESSLSGAILIGTPQEIALLDVAKAAAMLHKMQVPILGLVENMSYYELEGGKKYFPFGAKGAEKFARKNNLFFLGEIPIAEEISCSCDEGSSLFKTKDLSSAAEAFSAIAVRVQEQVESFEKLAAQRLKNFDIAGLL